MEIDDPEKDTKLFKCALCNCTGAWRSNIRRHIRVMHSETTNEICNECGLTQRNKFKLKRHMQEAHGISAKDDFVYPPEIPE